MTWTLPVQRMPVERIGRLTPDAVLYDFDGPMIFTALSPEGRKLLVYVSFISDEPLVEHDSTAVGGYTRYLIAPTSTSILDRLRSGAITVHGALDQPLLWAADVDHSGTVARLAPLEQLADVPQGFRPAPNRTLWPHLMPLMSYRLIGDGLAEGTVPASVVSRAVDNACGALKRLVEIVRNVNQPTGRPTDSHRRDYDLIAQRFAFNSFEVAFAAGRSSSGEPTDDTLGRYAEVGARLETALSWLVSGTADAEDPSSEMLDVLNRLVPPSQGIVQEAELSGRLLGRSTRVRLTRQDATRVRSAIARHRRRRRDLLESEGRVRELDLDELTFILRNRGDDAPELKCSFVELLLDDVVEAFNASERVVVQGRLDNRGQLDVSAIQTLATTLASERSTGHP